MAKKEAGKTTAEKMAAFIASLVENHTITADVAGIIQHAIEAKKDKLNA